MIPVRVLLRLGTARWPDHADHVLAYFPESAGSDELIDCWDLVTDRVDRVPLRTLNVDMGWTRSADQSTVDRSLEDLARVFGPVKLERRLVKGK